MRNNLKFYIYIIVLLLFASVVWIKYDYENNSNVKENIDNSNELFLEFMSNNNITYSTFSCPAKNETIIYLDDEYLITSLGDLYKVKYDSLFDNGYNCSKVERQEKFKGFYINNKIIYDENYNFYNVDDFSGFDIESSKYYKEDLNNLSNINKKYPYIHVYDVEASSLKLDSSFSSNNLLIDHKGNINVYTNYGYPNAYNLIVSDDTEILFDRLDYVGVVLSIYRSHNNDLLDLEKVGYIDSLMEVPKELYGIRLITTKGLYNEVIDKECNLEVCDTVLEMDKDFSKYFNNIVYSNGKYIFTKENPTTIYNIENYISSK